MQRIARVISLAVFSVLTSACAIGPKFVPDLTLPATPAALHGKKVIVSGFMGARYAASVTQSNDIQTVREYIGTRDISPDIAQGLQARGIDAEARAEFSPQMLQHGELLLRGKVTAAGGPGWAPGRANNWVNFVLVLGTLGVVGMIAPTPIPWTAVVDLSYGADVLDANGRFLAHASETTVDAEFDSYYFWGVTNSEVNERTFANGTERVTERLAEWFGK